MLFASALDSAFLRSRRMNFTYFSGQRPIVKIGQRLSCKIRRVAKRTLSSLELLRLASTSNTSSETAERNDLLVLLDITQVVVGLGELEAWQPTSVKNRVLQSLYPAAKSPKDQTKY